MSEGQFLALALVPVFTAVLSMCGSTLIILDIVYDRQKRRSVYHRIMLVFSFFDLINSLSMGITTLPVPADLGVLWAIGNDATCNFQGYIAQMGGTACMLYNATLTIYFVQVIRFQKKETQLKKWEWFYHIPPFVVGVGTATTSLALGWFGFSELWCWFDFSDPHLYLIRTWAFWYGPCWLCFLTVLIGMSIILRYVYVTERDARRHDATNKMRSELLSQAYASTTASSALVSNDNWCLDDDDILDKIDEYEEEDDQGENRPGDISSPEEQAETGRGIVALEPATRNSSVVTLSSKQKREMRRQKFLDRTKRTREVAMQALYYVLSFYVIYFFCTVDRLYYSITGIASPFGVSLCHVLLEPSQGIFNFLVYRMKYVKGWRDKNKNATRCQIMLVYLAISPWKDRAFCKPKVRSTTYVPTNKLSGDTQSSKVVTPYVTDMTGAVTSSNATTTSGDEQ